MQRKLQHSRGLSGSAAQHVLSGLLKYSCLSFLRGVKTKVLHSRYSSSSCCCISAPNCEFPLLHTSSNVKSVSALSSSTSSSLVLPNKYQVTCCAFQQQQSHLWLSFCIMVDQNNFSSLHTYTRKDRRGLLSFQDRLVKNEL